MKAIVRARGNPRMNEAVHRHLPRPRKGLIEGIDYPVSVVCFSGAYHTLITIEDSFVTCKHCLDKMKGQ